MDGSTLDMALEEINTNPDVKGAFQKVIESAKAEFPSKIWDEYGAMPFDQDIEEAIDWIQGTVDSFPKGKGIYLGLYTSTMEEGKGFNIEIGLSSHCDPGILSGDWAYDCDYYGEHHLIRGLFAVSDSFENEKWTNDERSEAEYLIFLVYSGLVLREALLNTETENDFLSLWGFHDGDMFLLVNKTGEERSVLADIDA